MHCPVSRSIRKPLEHCVATVVVGSVVDEVVDVVDVAVVEGVVSVVGCVVAANAVASVTGSNGSQLKDPSVLTHLQQRVKYAN